jgi:signal peptidase I
MGGFLAMVARMWASVSKTFGFVFGPIRSRWAAMDAWWARILPGWRGEAASFGLWILFFFFLMPTFLWQPFHIPSASMENTLIEGDYIFVTKYAYGYSEHSMYPWPLLNFSGRVWAGMPERGDVAVFKLPSNPKIDYIKRIVGLPGDRLQVINGVLHINGQAVGLKKTEDWAERNEKVLYPEPVPQFIETLPNGKSHPILDRNPSAPYDETKEFVVPAGHYFVMGDNRDNSEDSRAPSGMVGYVPYENLVGRADLIFFSVKADYRWWQIWRFPFVIRFDRLMNSIS